MMRYGMTCIEPSERLRTSGWRQVWSHPSGALAMRHPSSVEWVVSMDGGLTLDGGWSSSLQAAARSIERRLATSRVTDAR